MRQNANSRRSRGRGGRKSGNSRNQVFDSNGPGARVRGNASQIYEKYQQLARDAASSGDRVAAENLLQHAEHYFRLMALNAPRPDQSRENGQDNDSDDGDGYDGDDQESRSDSDDDRRPQAASNGGGSHGNGNGRGNGSSDDSSGDDGDSAPAPRRRRRRSSAKDNADGDKGMNAEAAEGDTEPMSA